MNPSLPPHWSEMSFSGLSPHGFVFEPFPYKNSYQLNVVHIRVYLGFPLLVLFYYYGIYIYIPQLFQ